MKDIAIIGIDFKTSMAQNLEEFWYNIKNGIDCITTLSKERQSDIYDYVKTKKHINNRSLNNKFNLFSKGGYLEEVDKFDYHFFGMSPKSASLMDPHQRLFLESSWRIIESAGYNPKDLKNTNTGVFIGTGSIFSRDYTDLIAHHDPDSLAFSFIDNLSSVIPSRISYVLDLKGPTMVVDTACSAALVAVHLACEQLQAGKCDMMIAGGVSINLFPVKRSDEEKIGIDSSDDKARTFDDRSDGTGWGEGVGGLLLKPLENALKDGDYIHAVIKGHSINQDGYSLGITIPNINAQKDLLLEAWEQNNIDPETISYIEAHGTGTNIGDPIEIEALKRAFNQYTNKKQFCCLGSIKPNIGHIESTAGLAGLIKLVLSLKNKELPPQYNFRVPNRKIQFENSPLYINNSLKKWESKDCPRRGGVSAFGMSGTNCHILLEEFSNQPDNQKEEGKKIYIFSLSAKTKSSLQNLIKEYQKYFEKTDIEAIQDICYTANKGRDHYTHRLMILCENINQLSQKISKINLEKLSDSENHIYYEQHEISNLKEKVFNKTKKEIEALSQSANDKVEELKEDKNNLKLATELAILYIQGANIDWDLYYLGSKHNKAYLPTYRFDKKRCWISSKQKKTKFNAIENQENKSLLQKQLISTVDEDIFHSVFRKADFWEIRDHKVEENCFLVGTAFMEIILQAAQKLNYEQIAIQNLTLLAPLIFTDEQDKEIQIIVKKGKNPKIKIYSKQHKNYVLHAETGITAINEKEKHFDLELVKNHLNFYEQMSAVNFPFYQYGERWNNLKEAYIHSDKSEFLSYLELPGLFIDEIKNYILHPALMDIAIGNIALYEVSKGLKDSFYLPFFFKKVNVYNSIPSRFYSHIKTLQTSDDSIGFDVTLIDPLGNILVEIREYKLKRVNKNNLLRQKSALYHSLTWSLIEENDFIANPDKLKLDMSSIISEIENKKEHVEYKEKVEPAFRKLVIWAIDKAFKDLGIELDNQSSFSISSLIEKGNIKHKQYFLRLLQIMQEADLLKMNGDQFVLNQHNEENIKDLIQEIAKFPFAKEEFDLLYKCCLNVFEILVGKKSSTEVLFSDWNLISNFYRNAIHIKRYNSVLSEILEKILKNRKHHKKIRILELGAGTGSITSYILPKLVGYNVEYCFSDVSQAFLNDAKQRFKEYSFVDYKLINIEEDLKSQGIEYQHYDFVLAANVLHISGNLKKALLDIQKILKKDGVLLTVELTQIAWWLDLVFGMTEGWWNFKQDGDWRTHAILNRLNWKNVLTELNFKDIHFFNKQDNSDTKVSIFMARKTHDPIKKDEVLLLFNDKPRTYKKIKDQFADENIIEVEFGDQWQENQNNFVIENKEEHYIKLLNQLKDRNIQKIIHFSSLDSIEAKNAEDIQYNLKIGLESLTFLVKSLVKNNLTELDLFIATKKANKISLNEDIIYSENATIIGFSKVVNREYPKLKMKILDIDDSVSEDILLKEIYSGNELTPLGFREGKKYAQLLKEVDIEKIPTKELNFKKEGVYVITGGMAGIGLEIANYIAEQNQVNLVLINRSSFPQKHEWQQILYKNKDKDLVKRIQIFEKIEKNGSHLLLKSGDVSNEQEMQKVFNGIREKFGKINGVIHCAGILRDKLLINKEIDEFRAVLAPKVLGTFILSKITKQDNLDFLILFSSLATFLGLKGQADYAAANSYLDSFAQAHKNVQTINWTAWDEVGMVANYEKVDIITESLSTKVGTDCFAELIKKDIAQILVGKFKYESPSIAMLNEGNLILSDDISLKINPLSNSHQIQEAKVLQQKESPKGVQGELTEIWKEVLGFDEIDINESFYSLGGDSIMAMRLSSLINSSYPDFTDVTDIFAYPSIHKLTLFIEEKLNKKTEKIEEENSEDIDDMLKKLSQGEISLEDASKLINLEEISE